MNPITRISLVVSILISLASCGNKNISNSDNELFSPGYIEPIILQKLENAIVEFNGMDLNPRSIDNQGNIITVRSADWTSGFFPGCLWFAFELSGDTVYRNAAMAHTEILEKEKMNNKTHDMGFKMLCSFGNGFRLTSNERYREILIESAYTLAGRFNENTGCIRSWDHNKDKWEFPVIIDNMMNLELLMWAFNETDDSSFYKISVSHADQSLKNHFRDDFSSFHVVDYDTLTGAVLKKNTHQGYSDNSVWSRGQSWGLYGYTMMYRETQDEKYLNQALKIADFIFSQPNLNKDLIPYWDMNAPDIPDAPKDASAAAITASALYELGSYVPEKDRKRLHSYADKIMASLSSDEYLCPETSKYPFILCHSTGHYPKNSEVDKPIIYADYYFIEALLRKKTLELSK